MAVEKLEEHEEDKKEMSYVSREELDEAVSEVKEMIEEVKAKLEEVKEEEVVEADGHEEEEKEELTANLAEPSVAPLKHNPEGNKSVGLKRIGQNRKTNTPMDRIWEKISNIN
jgi:CRISPR/Cas system CSM-associated protein Csm4 (group 5 of RAMP superfamily)